MKQLLLLLIVVLISSGAVIAADSGPITMRTGQNITLSDTSYINVGSNNYTLSTDRINQSQGFTGLGASTMAGAFDFNGNTLTDAKIGNSLPFVTVGPYDWCDYQTDHNVDETEINAALVDSGYVILCGDFEISDPILLISDRTLDGYNATITLADGANCNGIYTGSGYSYKNITVKNIYLDGNKENQTTYSKGIYLHGVTDGRVENCEVINANTSGIYAANSVDITFEDCEVSYTGHTSGISTVGIQFENVTDGYIIGNDVHDTACFGIYVYLSTNYIVRGNSVDNVTKKIGVDDAGYGIQNFNGDVNGIICENFVNDTEGLGIGSYGDIDWEYLNYNMTIRDNKIHYTNDYGIFVSKTVGYCVDGNTINNAGTDGDACRGIYSDSAGPGYIRSNHVNLTGGSYGHGIQCINGTGLIVDGNNVINAGQGPSGANADGINIYSTFNSTIANNIISNSKRRDITEQTNSDYNIFIGNHLKSATTWSKNGANTVFRHNLGYRTEAWGATSVADGGTITHTLGTTPTGVVITPTLSGTIVAATAKGSTTFTVGFSGTTTTQTVYWYAWV